MLERGIHWEAIASKKGIGVHPENQPTISPAMPETTPPPVCLTIAGSDNSAGAGTQADLKTFSALGVYGLTAITCVVAEVPGQVSAIHPIPADIVAQQIKLSLAAFPVA